MLPTISKDHFRPYRGLMHDRLTVMLSKLENKEGVYNKKLELIGRHWRHRDHQEQGRVLGPLVGLGSEYDRLSVKASSSRWMHMGNILHALKLYHQEGCARLARL